MEICSFAFTCRHVHLVIFLEYISNLGGLGVNISGQLGGVMTTPAASTSQGVHTRTREENHHTFSNHTTPRE